MTMHLVRGMSTINSKTRKKKQTKTAAILEEERKMAKLLKRVGYSKESAKRHRNTVPDYSVSRHGIPTSDKISPIAGKRKENVYTGDELAGVGQLHKSNLVPIRKDNKEAAKEIARMRRG
jgi:hypothetical protein